MNEEVIIRKNYNKIKGIDYKLGPCGSYDIDDIIQEICIGIVLAYRKNPKNPESYYLDAGKYYAMDKLKRKNLI